MADSTNVRGGDVNPDQMPRWIRDRKLYHAERTRENDRKRQVVPFSNGLENLVRLEAQNKLSPEMKASVIRMAKTYALLNKLEFDGTITGAIRLAAHADRVVRDAVEIASKVAEE